MASDQGYVDYIIEQFRLPGQISGRKMMGEYVLYMRDKVFGGIYDNRLLVKSTPSSKELMPNAPETIPYEGAKHMLFVEDVENETLLQTLVQAMYDELPVPKPKKRKMEKMI